MSATTNPSALDERSTELRVVSTNPGALVLDQNSMDSMYRLAEIMAKGRSTVPDHLKNNAGDCMAIVMQAVSWQMNPFAVAQKTHVVNGILGYEAQLVNAVIQSSGVTKDRFNYEWYGPWEKIIGKSKVIDKPAVGKYGDKDYKKATQYRMPDYDMNDETGLGVRVSATLKGESEPRVLDLLLVQASVRNSPLWATDPKQQLAYLGVKRWIRLYAPDVILGVYSPDELEESSPPREIDITPKPEQPKQPAMCTDEKFDANKDAWKKIVTTGRKTAQELIVFLEAKAPLTDEQKKEINTWRAASKEPVSDVQTEKPADPPDAKDPFVAGLDASGEYTPE